MPETHYRTCTICEAACGVEIHVEGNRVTSIKGNNRDVHSAGFLCTKGLALADLHNDPDRLRSPMIRTANGFRKASWEEAFAFIHEKLGQIHDKYGRNSVGVYLGNPNVHNISLVFYNPNFLRSLRTSNIFSASSVDQLPKQLACALMYGNGYSIPVPDIDSTDYFLMIGANPVVSNGSLWTWPDIPGKIRALRERGGKLIVIDPRRTETAKRASEHLFIRPGTDAHFLAALVNVILTERLAKLGRYEGLINGVEELTSFIQPFTPEIVSELTSIPAQSIRRIAVDFAKAKHAVAYGRMGTCTQEFGTTASWLLEVMNAITGNVDRLGGTLFPLPAAATTITEPRTGKEKGIRPARRRSRVSGLPEVFSEFPAAAMAEEIDTPGDGQLKAFFIIGGNPVISTPDGSRLARALDSLELLVSLDLYITETSKRAHVILPGVSILERSHYDWVFAQFMPRSSARYSPQLFEKPAEMMHEWEILLRLAAIAGGKGLNPDLEAMDLAVLRQWMHLGAKPEGSDDEELIRGLEGRGPDRIVDYLLRAGPYGPYNSLNLEKLKRHPHGIDFGAAEGRLEKLLRTESGRIEIAPAYITADCDRMMTRLDVKSSGLVLIGRRHIKSHNSWVNNIERLAKGADRGALLVNPADGTRLGLEDGAMVRVRSEAGEVQTNVRLTDEMMPGVVSLPHGWGQGQDTGLSVAKKVAAPNINAITMSTRVDPLSGNAAFSGVPVQVENVPGH